MSRKSSRILGVLLCLGLFSGCMSRGFKAADSMLPHSDVAEMTYEEENPAQSASFADAESFGGEAIMTAEEVQDAFQTVSDETE